MTALALEDIEDRDLLDEDDDPRADLGYEPDRDPPRLVAAKAPEPFTAARGTCPRCKAGEDKPEGVALFPTAGGFRRTVCSTCQGRDNRDHVEQTRGVIRELRAAVAVGNTADERSCLIQLRSLVGATQADETARAIQAAIDTPAAKGRRR